MSKHDQIEARIQADIDQRKLEEQKLKIQEKKAIADIEEAESKKIHEWFWVITTIWVAVMLLVVFYGKAHSWFL